MTVITTHVAFAKTRVPPAKPPPQHAQPMPSVHAICLSSLGCAQISNMSVTQVIVQVHTAAIARKMPNIFPKNPLLPAPAVEALTVFLRPVLLVGMACRSARAARTASSREVKMSTKKSAPPIAKKYPSQPARRHSSAKCAASVSWESPLLMDPKATMPMTPRTTTIVP